MMGMALKWYGTVLNYCELKVPAGKKSIPGPRGAPRGPGSQPQLNDGNALWIVKNDGANRIRELVALRDMARTVDLR